MSTYPYELESIIERTFSILQRNGFIDSKISLEEFKCVVQEQFIKENIQNNWKTKWLKKSS